MIVLNESDLRAVLDYPSCIEAMRRVFIDLAEDAYFNPLRMRVHPGEGPNGMTFMPTLRKRAPRRWAMKQMVVTPSNPSRFGLDPLQGTVLLHDGDDGRLLAIAHAPTLTTIRTAAVSALATQTLAKPGARIVAILGIGVQGRSHVAAMRSILPDATLRVWGRTPDKTREFAARHGCEPADSIEAALRDADVVCTVTAALEPIVQRDWFKPGCHVNAVGSSHSGARELDAATVAAARLFVDRREGALGESGDVIGALREGAITPEHIQAELGEVLSGRHPGRRSDDEFTLYKSLGMGAQDLAAIELALQQAQQQRRGTEIAW
ncbi:MAG: ornithine cyclodeaminase family protein [Burkholderiaceae bacterium]